MKTTLKKLVPELKKKYDKLHHITIPVTEKETAEFIAKEPSKSELSAMSSKENTEDFNEMMFNVMIVAGDRQYIDDTPDFIPSVYLTLVQELGKLYQPKEASSTVI